MALRTAIPIPKFREYPQHARYNNYESTREYAATVIVMFAGAVSFFAGVAFLAMAILGFFGVEVGILQGFKDWVVGLTFPFPGVGPTSALPFISFVGWIISVGMLGRLVSLSDRRETIKEDRTTLFFWTTVIVISSVILVGATMPNFAKAGLWSVGVVGIVAYLIDVFKAR